MREYLERIFPIISKDQNGTAAERTWYLYDAINFVEFFVFLLLGSALRTIFRIVFGLVKFGVVLFLTYAFAFSIFYYFDNYMLEERKRSSVSRTKRPSSLGSWRENNSSTTKPPIASRESKLKEDINKTALKTDKSDVMIPSSHKESIRSQLDDNYSPRLYPNPASLASKVDDDANISTLKIEKSQFPPRPMDEDSDLSIEQVVRVGSFRRSSAENGRQSIVSRALADLANIETKTYSTENKPERISITKSDITAVKSTNV